LEKALEILENGNYNKIRNRPSKCKDLLRESYRTYRVECDREGKK
jgi:hypothetical protein